MIKLLSNVPDFLLTCISIGKKLGLLQLVQDAQETVTKDRAKYFHAVIDIMVNSEMSRQFGIPADIINIAKAMGHPEVGSPDIDNEWTDAGQYLVNLLSVILPFMSNLNTSRYFLTTTKDDQINLDDHQNSLSCLCDTIKLLIG